MLDSHLTAQTPPPAVWSDLEGRPRSSQSSIRGIGILPEPSSDSIFSRESAPLGGTSPDGGLFPRPASLRRDWSDGFPKRESVSRPAPISSRIPSLQSTRLSNADRIRPVSFGGISTNALGAMKITEAASLETRVKELEAQLSQLSNLVGPPPDWPMKESKSADTAPQRSGLSNPPVNALGLSSTSEPSPKSSTVSLPEQQLILTPEIPNTPGSRTEEVDKFANAVGQREVTLQALEGLGRNLNVDSNDKRATTSTIRASRPLSGSLSNRRSASPAPVTVDEYESLMALLKEEQQARKKLEARVEQLAALLRETGLHISAAGSSAISRSGSNVALRAESVPTPDLTPPPSSPSRGNENNRTGLGTFFQNFDGAALDTDDESFFDRPESAMESDTFETPTEERRFGLSHMDANDGNGYYGAPTFAHHEERTLSLSELTRRRSPVAV